MHINNVLNNINENRINCKKHKTPFGLFRALMHQYPTFTKNEQIEIMTKIIQKYNSLSALQNEIKLLSNMYYSTVSNALIPLHSKKMVRKCKIPAMTNKFPPKIRITGGFLP